MSSGKSQQQAVQQPPQPQPMYGTNTSAANTTATNTFTPWSRAAGTYDNMASQLQGMSGAGPQVIGPSAATQQGWGMAQGAIPGMGQIGQIGQGNYNFLSRAADVANNPYVQGMLGVNNYNTNQQLRNEWLPAITQGAIASGSGGMGSSRAGLAQAQAIGNASQQLSNANAGILNAAYGQGLNAQQGALGSMGALQSALAMPALAMGQIGQQQEQYQRDAADAPWRHLQNQGAALQYLSPLGTLSGATNATGTASSGPLGYNGEPPAAALYPDPSQVQLWQQQQPQQPQQAGFPFGNNYGLTNQNGMWYNPN